MSNGLPDILAEDLSVVFCGINPGATAAAVGRHFVSPSNRFWRAIHLAGFTPVQIRPEDDRAILQYGFGLTTAVARPTKRAGELSRRELARSAAGLRDKIERYAPQIVAFLGKAAYAAIAQTPEIAWGPQAAPFAGASVWVLPNPSGLNRNFTLDDLVAAYRQLHAALPRNVATRLISEANGGRPRIT